MLKGKCRHCNYWTETVTFSDLGQDLRNHIREKHPEIMTQITQHARFLTDSISILNGDKKDAKSTA